MGFWSMHRNIKIRIITSFLKRTVSTMIFPFMAIYFVVVLLGCLGTQNIALNGKKPRTLSEPTRGTLPLDPINRTPQPLNP